MLIECVLRAINKQPEDTSLKKKTPQQRTDEFCNRAILVKRFQNPFLTLDERETLLKFWEKREQLDSSEPIDNLYIQLYYFLKYYIITGDVYDNFINFKSLPLSERYKILNITPCNKNKNKYDYKTIAKNFTNRKHIKHLFRDVTLQSCTILELENLFKTHKKASNSDSTVIIADMLLSAELDFINRYQIITSSDYNTLEYFEARYGSEKGKERFDAAKHKQREQARHNFKNTTQYWIDRGYTEIEAINQVSKEQTMRASKIKKGIKTCRSLQYWIDRGYSEDVAIKKVHDVQSRSVNYFINKYGQTEGIKRYQYMLDKRQETFNSRPEDEKKHY